MATAEAVSRDGSWKISVEVFAINLFVYQALGVTTRVFAKQQPNWWQRLWGAREAWVPANASQVSAGGTLGTSRLPGASAPIPGSPRSLANASEADCRAWSVGVGITFVFDAPIGGFPPNPGPGGGPSMTADRVTGSGSATRGGETLQAGPLSAP